MNELIFTVSEIDSDIRVDKWIMSCDIDVTRSALQKLITDGAVTVNDKAISKNHKLKNGDTIKIIIPEPVLLDAVAENIPVDIVYQDDDLLVVNKPKGMVVHPAPSNYSGTLVNALLYHCEGKLSSINGVIRPGIVHRIDKMTSGLLIVAKTDKAHLGLAEQIKEHSFSREYMAIVHGHLKEHNGFVEAPIGRHHVDRKKMCVTEQNSKYAKTEYTVIEEFNGYSLVKLNLYTGRTHQIRVHMAYIGHSVLGDDVYGKASRLCDGQCLHAKKIGFVHPITNAELFFDSELPEYFVNALDKIKKL